ncbi:MAG: outer membrane protein/protective antigen [Acidobacteria bacterium]|nr:outer membrane protein/protective antigen [Acidobacteriota bacterium]
MASPLLSPVTVTTDRAPGRRSLVLSFSIALMLAPRLAAPAQDAQAAGVPPGWITPTPRGLVAEPALLTKLGRVSESAASDDREATDGVYVETGNMITGEGWISAGPGYRRHALNDRLLLDASASVSWNLYNVMQASIEVPHLAHDRLTVGVQVMRQDVLQVKYFGLGEAARASDQSGYRFRSTDIIGYATVRPARRLSVSGRFGAMPRPSLSAAAGAHVAVPSTIDMFSEASAPGIASQPSFLHADVLVAADLRDHRGHPTGGGLYQFVVAVYSDRDTGRYSFRRYEVEGAQFVPLFTKRWILALHAREVFSDTSTGSVVPFYLMPSLGGKNTLRGYDDYRFHDDHMQAFSVESRWPLFTHLDAAVFGDAGKVASRVADLDLRRLRTSYGAGLRLHNATATLLRFDVGHSTEGWHAFIKISDPFKRSMPISGRSAVVPFVP